MVSSAVDFLSGVGRHSFTTPHDWCVTTPRLASNAQSFCLGFPNPEIIGVCCHSWLSYRMFIEQFLRTGTHGGEKSGKNGKGEESGYGQ